MGFLLQYLKIFFIVLDQAVLKLEVFLESRLTRSPTNENNSVWVMLR